MRASTTSTTNSPASDIFWPNPPPTSGAITRKSASGMPIRSAMAVRIKCGICVEQVSVTRPDAASKAACAPRGSIGSAFWRRERASTATTLAAAARAASKPGVFTRPSTMTFAGASAWTRGAPSSRAARASTTGSVLDLDLDLIGDVLGRLRALRQHGGNRLSDVAHDAVGEDRLGDRHVVELVQHRPDRLDVPRSAAVTTVAPSGAAMRTMRPAATELRTKRTYCAAGRSPVKRPTPVTSAGSSSLRIDRPTQGVPAVVLVSFA